MRRRPAVACLLMLGAIVTVAPSARAQAGRKLQVNGVQGIAFGQLLAGMPRTIARTDATRAGRIDLIGQNGDQILLQFSLPTSLVGPGAAAIPLSFAPGGAGFSESQAIGSQVAFDPRQSQVIVLSKTGRGSVFLGATASPSPAQPSGSYAATVTLTTAYIQ